MLLQDENYEDANGKQIAAKSITSVASFIYIADGFFNWTCPSCRKDSSSRAFKINGTVHQCPNCGTYSLLLRSDCAFVSSMTSKVNALESELSSLKYDLERYAKKLQVAAETIEALRNNPDQREQQVVR